MTEASNQPLHGSGKSSFNQNYTTSLIFFLPSQGSSKISQSCLLRKSVASSILSIP